MQNLFEFPNVILYDAVEKLPIPQSTPRGNFTEYAKRYQKNTFFLRRKQSNSHWGNVFNSLVLLKAQTSNNEIFCSVGLYARNNSFITDDKRRYTLRRNKNYAHKPR